MFVSPVDEEEEQKNSCRVELKIVTNFVLYKFVLLLLVLDIIKTTTRYQSYGSYYCKPREEEESGSVDTGKQR